MSIKKIFCYTILSCISLQVYCMTPIKHWQSRYGGQVYFVPSIGLPMVDVRLVFDAGSARDGRQEGIATLTANLLETGAGQWNADQLAQRFDDIGARCHSRTSKDYTEISLRSLTRVGLLPNALETFQKIVSAPTFSELDFLRLKNQQLIALKQQQERPDYIVKKAYYQALYDEHPYAHLKEGDLQSVSAIQLSDIKAFYQKYYVRNNAILVIVGNVTEAKAQKIAELLLAELPLGEKAEQLPHVNVRMTAKKQHIDFSSAQTHILAGLPILSRKDEDYFPLYVGNYILGGGGLVSRMFEEVREKRGLAYSAYSYFSPLEQQGPFTMGLQTQNKQRSLALNVMLQTLSNFIKEGPTKAELIAAKKNLTGGFVLRLDSNRKLLDYVTTIAFYKLPLRYLETFQDKVTQVTLEDIKLAFHRRVKMNLLQIVSVGGS